MIPPNKNTQPKTAPNQAPNSSRPTKKTNLGMMPSDATGRRYMENFKYCRHYDTVTKKNTENPEEPWITNNQYPLSYRDIWHQHQNPNKIIALRPGQESNFIYADIDSGSLYHHYNGNGEAEQNRFLEAMEEIGLGGYVRLQSSYSEGIHIIFPLKKAYNSYKIGKAITYYLINKGFTVKPGTLEIFPNNKSYDKEKVVLFQAIRLPLQPNSGSYLLDKDFTPYSTDIDEFNELIEEQRENQDLRKFKRFIDNPPRLKNYSLLIKPEEDGEYSEATGYSEKAREWKESLEFFIAEGFSGRGQTDEITRRTICYAIVFLGFQGEQLIEWCTNTIRNAPNFYKYSRHQHDIHKKVRYLCRLTEKRGYYLKYRAFPKRDRKYYEIYKEGVDRWRAKSTERKESSLKQDARDRILQVVNYLIEKAIALSNKKTELINLVNSVSQKLFGKGFSQRTLYQKEIRQVWESLLNGKSTVSADEKDENTENAETQSGSGVLPVTDEKNSEIENLGSSEMQSGSGVLPVILYDVSVSLVCPEGRPTLPSGGLIQSNQEIEEVKVDLCDNNSDLTPVLDNSVASVEPDNSAFNGIGSEILANLANRLKSFGSSLADQPPQPARSDARSSSETIHTIKIGDFEIEVNLGNISEQSEYQIQERITMKLTFEMVKARKDPDRKAAIRTILEAEKAKLAALSPLDLSDMGKGSVEVEPELIAPEKHRSSQQPESEQEKVNITASDVSPADEPPPSPVLREKGIKLVNRKIFKALEGLGVERNSTLTELIAKYPESQVWKAIDVLKVNLDKAYSPVGLFIKALRDGWHLDNRDDLSLENPVKIFPAGFEEAYKRGVKLGYFEDLPMDNLSFFNNEPQIWVVNPNDKKGFTSMSWSEAIEFIGFG